MSIEIRELKTPAEMEEVVRLQVLVGGLPERHVVSPITLSTLAAEYPRMGWVLGAFEDEKMVGFATALTTFEPGVVYGFMLAVDPEAQNARIGARLLQHNFDQFREAGARKVCWAYEPLEAKNAHIYLNKMGGRCVRYVEEYYYLDSGLHQTLPQDRFLVELELDAVGPRDPGMELSRALDTLPVARPDDTPAEDRILVEVPHKVHELLPENPERAMAFRMDTRMVFNHYVNDEGYRAVNLLVGGAEGEEPRAFYLLEKE